MPKSAAMNFMSLSALRRMHARWSLDLDTGPLPLFSATPSVAQDQFSQEFQLQSSDASRVRWVAGLYYIHIDEQYDPTISITAAAFRRSSAAGSGKPCSPVESLRPMPPMAKAHVPIATATELTLGLRYTIEHRSVEANGERLFDTAPFVRPIPGLPLLSEQPLRNSDTFRELTWRASLDRHFSDELMGYLVASRGFQSGGWNLQTPQNPGFRSGKARRFRSRAEIRGSLATLPGGCERLSIMLFRPPGFRAHSSRPGDDQRRFRAHLRAGAAAGCAARPKDRHHLWRAASPCAVQQLSQRDLHQLQPGRGASLSPDNL